MKRKWQLPTSVLNYVGAAALIWFGAGMTAFLSTRAATERHPHEAPSTATWIVFAGWLAPFVLAGLIFGCRQAWAYRPKREWVPVKEDAREAHRR